MKDVAPEIEVMVGKFEPALQERTASTVRPPQPVADFVSALAVCAAWTWSECEKSEKGFGTAPLM